MVLTTPKELQTSTWQDKLYGYMVYWFVRATKPEVCVELGTFAGCMSYCIALALKINKTGFLYSYDLWDDYPYRHVSKKEAEQNLKDLPVKLIHSDALIADLDFGFKNVDFLFVDISNTGDTFLDIAHNWYHVLKDEGTIMLEGGLPERDEVGWMTKYNKTPIRKALSNPRLTEFYDTEVIDAYPGLTILTKR